MSGERDLQREPGQAKGQAGAAGQRRVLVAVDGLGQSEYLVRIGLSLAERQGVPWSVVTVDTGAAVGEAQQLELGRSFALARRLGGDASVLHGDSIADALLDHASRSGATAILLGRTKERPIARLFNRTLTQQLIERGAHLQLTIVSSRDARKSLPRSLPAPGGGITAGDVGLAAAATVLAIGLGWLAERWIGLDDLSLVFIVAVVVVASRTRMAAAVLASLLCFLAYNFIFIEPRLTFYVAARQGVTTIVLFLIAALVAGRLASRLRMQVLALQGANVHATTLQALGRALTTAADLDQVVAASRESFRRAFDAEVIVHIDGRASDREALSEGQGKDQEACEWASRQGEATGRFAEKLTSSRWWFLPLLGHRSPLGAVGLKFPGALVRLGVEQRRLAEAMADEVAQATIRARLVAELEDARVSSQSERLRSALLSSVSHDLRSPLAAIIGAASSLDSYAAAISAEDRHSLLETIRMEGERLDRYIENLLDMTRLGHGGLRIERDWIGLDELIGSAVSRLQRYQFAARFHVSLPENLGPIWVHPALVEQAVFNVLENAAKFSPPDEVVTIEACLHGGALQLEVSDLGPGVPENERERIFDMFHSVERGDRGRQGRGLGLAICRGMIGAHGGSVVALPGMSGRGTTIRITLPDVQPIRDDPG